MADDFALEVETEETADTDAPDTWADEMAGGADYDESIGDETDESDESAQHDDRVLATDELDDIDDDDAPEGAAARDEEFEGDDPADIPDEHTGVPGGFDTEEVLDEDDDDDLGAGPDRDDDWE